MRRVPSVHGTSFKTNALQGVVVVGDVDVDSMVGGDDPEAAQAQRRCTHVEDSFLDHVWWIEISISSRIGATRPRDNQMLLWLTSDSPWYEA